MEPDETDAPRERKPTAVLLALALLGLLAALWVSPTLGYWSETAYYIESGYDPTYPLAAAVIYTLTTAAAAVAFFGVLKRRFWGRVTGIVVGGLGLLGTIPALSGTAALTGIAVLGFFGAIIGLLCTAQANAWCPRPSRRTPAGTPPKSIDLAWPPWNRIRRATPARKCQDR
jgi:hypothetical protein